MTSSTWRASPTVANLGPGFDVLGVAISGVEEELGDVVTAMPTGDFSGVRLTQINPNRDNLPLEGNVVEVVGRYVAEHAAYYGGIALALQKRMRIGTGMGSSASSAVASAMSVNALLSIPYEKTAQTILDAIVAGEAAAIKKLKGHADNVFPALCGGFVYIGEIDGHFIPHPIDNGFNELYFVVVHPEVVVNTGEARDALSKAPYDIGKLVEASRIVAEGRTFSKPELIVLQGGKTADVINYLNGFGSLLASIKQGDLRLFGKAMMADNIVTPVRAAFIPGYQDAKESALSAGAYGFTIGGSGPTVVSVTDSRDAAYRIGEATQDAFRRKGVESKLYVCTVDMIGATPVI